jgi:hypothetical protein
LVVGVDVEDVGGDGEVVSAGDEASVGRARLDWGHETGVYEPADGSVRGVL